MSTTKKRVQFDYALRATVIQSDRAQLNVRELDKRGLQRIAKGKIFLTIDKPREFVVIDSEVLDYLVQLKGVVDQIDAGNHNTFTVSGDYFSNNLKFAFEKASETLEIQEANGGDFTIKIPYKDFRTSLLAFYKQTLADFLILYPELNKNDAYHAMT